MAVSGPRRGAPNAFRRLLGWAVGCDLRAFVVPGTDYLGLAGIDPQEIGLWIVANPRHANVLVIVGDVPKCLERAVTVVYAQMPRPRAILLIGTMPPESLPSPEVIVEPEPHAVAGSVAKLRHRFANAAFSSHPSEFSAPMFRTRTQYTCPMHPEVLSDQPGKCPICGMNLVSKADADHEQTGAHTEHAGRGGRDHAQMDHVTDEMAQPAHRGHGQEPVHQPNHEASSTHEPRQSHDGQQRGHQMDRGEHAGHDDHAAHGHGHAGHGGGSFMSMVAMTKDLPRSRDGLPMERLDASFGPLFPGLPAGLNVTLTLDGDVVVRAELHDVESDQTVAGWVGDPSDLPNRLAGHDRLAPGAYSSLAERAVGLVEAAGYVHALECTRVISHLGWLASFCSLLGLTRLANEATDHQIAVVRMLNPGKFRSLGDQIVSLSHQIEGTALLSRRLQGVGQFAVPEDAGMVGPVARAAGLLRDARLNDPLYQALGFAPIVEHGNDALARLRVRLAEIRQSVELLRASDQLTGELAATPPSTTMSGELPRGRATLVLERRPGQVIVVRLETPSTRIAELVNQVATGHEVTDALTAIASLDLSPWELAG